MAIYRNQRSSELLGMSITRKKVKVGELATSDATRSYAIRKPHPDANGGYVSCDHCSYGMYDLAVGSRSGLVRRPSEPSQM